MPRMRRQSAELLAQRQTERRTNPKPFTVLGRQFDKYMREIEYLECDECSIRFPLLPLVRGKCVDCRNNRELYTRENDMDIGDIPDELKNLSMIEQILIAKIHPMISIYRIRGCQYAYRGNVISFPQDVNDIVNVLPHNIEDLNAVMLFEKVTDDGAQYFKVRPARIERALIWLKTNHRYYSNIVIDRSRIARLSGPLENIASRLANLNDVKIEDEANGTEVVNESFIPLLPNVTHCDTILNSLRQDTTMIGRWPRQSSSPINEFRTEGYITMAFPCLFPYGRGDLRFPRPKEISADKYFKYLLRYKDGRFDKDSRFPFFAFNSRMRWEAMRCGTVYSRRSNLQQFTIDEVIARIESDANFVNNLMYFSSSIRGTRPYWRQRCSELIEMVGQLGKPTFFFTLSAADYHWPDLFRLLTNNNAARLTEKDRVNLMHDNPHITAWFFQQRAFIFITKVMSKIFGIRDYWFRFEWQWRGSPHVHGVFWMDGDHPNLEDIESLSSEQIERACTFFDRYCSAMNYNQQTRAVEHPSRKRISDIADSELETDLNDCLNMFQRHTRHGRHCQRKMRNSTRYGCRFGFPQTIRSRSTIIRENGILQFMPQRNDELMQKYNRIITMIWRSNTDFSVIVSEDAMLNYLAKYASKSEQASESYRAIARRIAECADEDTNPATVIKKIMLKSVCERDYSAQEIAHLQMGYPLYRASRTFIPLVLNDDWTPVFENSESVCIRNYKSREIEYDAINLYVYSKKFRRVGDRTVRRTTEVILRVIPRLKFREDSDNEPFYKNQCKLYIPWRNSISERKSDNITWAEYFTHANISNVVELVNLDGVLESDLFEEENLD